MKATEQQLRRIHDILFQRAGLGKLSHESAARFIAEEESLVSHFQMLRAKDWNTEAEFTEDRIRAFVFRLKRQFKYDETSQRPIMENAIKKGQLILDHGVKLCHCFGAGVGVDYDVLVAPATLKKDDVLTELDARRCRPGSPFEAMEGMRNVSPAITHIRFVSIHGEKIFVVERDFQAEKSRSGVGRVVRIGRADDGLVAANDGRCVGFVGMRV